MLWWTMAVALAGSPPDHTHDLVNDLLTVSQTRKLQSSIMPCPKETCSRIPLNSPNAFARTLMTETRWLSMLNQYVTPNPIIPEAGEHITGRFLHHSSEHRDLWLFVNQQQVYTFYWAWDFDSLQSAYNPFDVSRQHAWQTHINDILATCEQVSVLARDDYGNRRAWSGTNCGGFNLWIEYAPADEQALRVLGVRQ